MFYNSDGNDTITDFNPAEDKLSFPSLKGNYDVEIDNGNTVISFGNTTITLQGVEMTAEAVQYCVLENED